MTKALTGGVGRATEVRQSRDQEVLTSNRSGEVSSEEPAGLTGP